MRLLRIVICGLQGCTIFFHTILQTARFPKKKLLTIKCVFFYSLQFCLKQTFLIRRRIERDMIKMYVGIHVKHPLFLSDFLWNLNFLERFSTNTQISNFMKVRPVEAALFLAERQTDRRRDRHDDANSRFSQFANAPKHVIGIAVLWRSDSVEFQAGWIKLLMNARNTMVIQKLTVAQKVKIFPPLGSLKLFNTFTFFFLETSLTMFSYIFIGIVKHSNPYTVLDMPLGLQEVKAPRISGRSAHESGKVFRPTYR